MLESMLADLDKFLGVKSVKGKKEMEEYYLLNIPPHHEVWIKSLEPGFYLKSTLAPLPGDNREELLIYLMKANFLGQGTGGSVISLDAEEKFLTLGLPFPYEGNYKIFRDKLEDFLNYLEYWQKELT